MLWDAIAVAWLGIVPGAALAAAPAAGSFDRVTRLALCTAFSPWIVSLAMAAGLATGVSAPVTTWSIAAATLPLAGLLVWRLAPERTPPRTALAGAFGIAIAIPLVWLLVLWLHEPAYRLFGRHNMMHSDLIYQLVRAPWPPEAPELAGLPMGYGWLGHGFNAALALWVDHPPTRLFPWSNALSLSACAVLMHRATRSLGASGPAAALAAALALLTFHPLLAVHSWFGIGEDASRIIAPITKFLFLDLMPASLPLLAVILWGATRQDARGSWLGIWAFPALASIYVAAVPAGLCAVAGLAAAQLARDRSLRDAGRRNGLALAVGIVSLWLGLAWTPAGPEIPPLLWAPAVGIIEKGWDTLAGFAPWWLLGLPAAWAAWRRGQTGLAGLALAAAVLGAAYPLLLARHLEYKLVIYARLWIAPALAMTLLAPVRAQGRAWLVAACLAGLAGAASVPRALARVDHAQLEASVPIDESAFHLRWDDPENAAWIEAVRSGTPDDSVLVIRRCQVVLGALADRSLFAPCARDGRDIAGYTLWVPANLGMFRGHPQRILSDRQRTISGLYRATESDVFFRHLATIRQLGRPIALHLTAGDPLRLRWLGERGLGRELYADARHRVWWIPGDARAASVAGLDPGR